MLSRTGETTSYRKDALKFPAPSSFRPDSHTFLSAIIALATGALVCLYTFNTSQPSIDSVLNTQKLSEICQTRVRPHKYNHTHASGCTYEQRKHCLCSKVRRASSILPPATTSLTAVQWLSYATASDSFPVLHWCIFAYVSLYSLVCLPLCTCQPMPSEFPLPASTLSTAKPWDARDGEASVSQTSRSTDVANDALSPSRKHTGHGNLRTGACSR